MSKLTANRVALIAAFITSIAAGIAGVAKTVPGKTGETVLTVAGMIGAVGTAMTFAVGTMKWDATPVGQAVHAQKLGVTVPGVTAPASTESAPAVPALTLAGDPSLRVGSLEQGPGSDEPAEAEDLNSEVWLAARAAVPDATEATDATETTEATEATKAETPAP